MGRTEEHVFTVYYAKFKICLHVISELACSTAPLQDFGFCDRPKEDTRIMTYVESSIH
jgi:hypothetical protein